jgi:hypothetical protein
VSHGPVGSRKSSSRLFHTLMCTLSSKAKASDEFGLVILDQIPCVRRELVFEVCYEFLRTVQTYAPVAPQTDAQQVIKTGEVIHVRVRNEYVAHSQELPRWQNGDIADIAKVQEWLGHANISITRVYDHRKSRPKESAVFKVKY